MPGVFRRSLTGVTGFEEGPTLFTVDMRHSAVLLRGTALHVFFSNAYDCPECILHSRIDLESDWMVWEATEPVTLLAPDCDYEGADRPLDPSERGSVHERVRQLRDPGIFEEDGKTYLLYSVAGEYGLAIAELALD